MTQFSAWLSAEAKAERGGILWKRPIVRGQVFSFLMPIPADVSADSFAASLRLSPDAQGASLADFSVSVGAFEDDVTLVTFSLAAAQTDALPADDQGDGIVEVVGDVIHTPSGSSDPERIAAFVFQISGRVTA
jgi:hypothetical protein